MAVVIGLVGVVAGLLSRRSRTPGQILLGVLGAVASVAVLSRPTAGSLDVLAPLVALLASVGTFVVLHRLGRRSQQPAGGGAAGVSRRTLLVGSAAVAAGAGIAAAGGQSSYPIYGPVPPVGDFFGTWIGLYLPSNPRALRPRASRGGYRLKDATAGSLADWTLSAALDMRRA